MRRFFGILFALSALTALCAYPAEAHAVESVTYSGTGSTTIGPLPLKEGVLIVDWNGVPTQDLQFTIRTETGNVFSLVTLSVAGSTAHDFRASLAGGSFYCEVTCTGPWSITLRQPQPVDAPAADYFEDDGGRWVSEPFFLAPGVHTFEFYDFVGHATLIRALPQPPNVGAVYVSDPIGSLSRTDGDSIIRGVYGGIYVLAVRASDPWSALVSSPTLPPAPVHRFYNRRTATHFYTASSAERDLVLASWPDVFTYEGPAYVSDPMNTANNRPLYRFYNMKTGTHFYTASHEECVYVIKTWPKVYQYEGIAYLVAVQSGTPIHRFYNLRTGAHFYTASPEECALLSQQWPGVFRYEGVAYYVGQ